MEGGIFLLDKKLLCCFSIRKEMKCGGIARFSTERNLALSSISVKAQALQESNTGLQP